MSDQPDPRKCLHCDKDATRGMFCHWHSAFENCLSLVATVWQTREELAGLADKMSSHGPEQLAEFAARNGAWQLHQLANRCLVLGGASYGHALYRAVLARVQARRDLAPAKARPPAADVERLVAQAYADTERLERASTADLGLETPEFTLGL